MAESRDPTYHGVLIYDGECPFCSAASTALRRVRGIGAIAWSDEPARAFLEARFEEVPFALVLVDSEEERVYAGRTAASELCDRARMPVLVQDVVGENYESLTSAIRSTAAGGDHDPDPYHDAYPLAPAAEERFAALAAAADGTALAVRDR